MNDEAVIEEVDFTEFETLFQVPRFKTKELKAKEKAEKRVELLDQKRARGIGKVLLFSASIIICN